MQAVCWDKYLCMLEVFLMPLAVWNINLKAVLFFLTSYTARGRQWNKNVNTLRKNLVPQTSYFLVQSRHLMQNGWRLEISTSVFVTEEWKGENVTRVYDSQVLTDYPWLSVPKIVIMNVVLCVTYRHGQWAHSTTTIYDNRRLSMLIIFCVHIIGEQALTLKIDRWICKEH